jgi:ABC-2 type transport system permease protein
MNKITDNQLFRLIAAQFLEIIREPAVLFWGIVFPILMAWGLGIAFTQKNDITRKIAIVRYVGAEHGKSKLFCFLETNASKKDGQYTIGLKNPKLGNIRLVFVETVWKDAYTMLKKGKINLILEDNINSIQYHFDPASADAQMLYQQLNSMMTNGTDFYSANQTEIKPLTISGTRYIDFLIPGLLAMGVMMSATWGISYTMIERRSKKLLRRMVATPMKKSNFLIALVSVRFMMNVLEGLILFLFAWLVFGIHMQGSFSALLGVFIAGNIAFAGIAILVSSHTASPEVGNGIINALVTPMMVLSGVFFSYHNFPDWSQPVIENLPLTMLADSMRSIFNEGAGWAQVYYQIAVLSVTGLVCFVVGLKIFKWY